MFGEIVDGGMQLSEIGKLTNQYWFTIPSKFPFILLDEFVVMPNHIHGIVTIDKPPVSDNVDNAITQQKTATPLPNVLNISKIPGGFAVNKNPMLNDNLWRVMNLYKGRVT